MKQQLLLIMLCGIMVSQLSAQSPVEIKSIQLVAPPEFTAQDQIQLTTTQEQLTQIRKDILNGKRTTDLLARARTLQQQVQQLQDKQRRWRDHEAMGGGVSSVNVTAALDDAQANEAVFRQMMTLYREVEALDRRGDQAGAQQWYALAQRFNRFHGWMNQRLATFGTDRFYCERKVGGHYLRRTLLVQSVCYLKASVASFKAHQPSYRDLYREGIELLEKVIRTRMFDNELPAGAVGREPTAYDYFSDGMGILQPVRTSTDLARMYLGNYCPWGVAIYCFLYDAGLAKYLDFSAINHDYGGSFPPKLSEANLLDNVPTHIASDLAKTVGTLQSDGHYVGEFQLGQETQPVVWDWVTQKPEVHIWFVSPTITDIQSSDVIRTLFKGISIIKDPVGYVTGYAVGVAIDNLLERVAISYGEGHPVTGAASMVVQANSYGFDSDFLIEGKGFNWKGALKQGFVTLLDQAEKKEMDLLFDGLDPQHTGISPMTSYSGNPIPPIMIRSEVFGFVAVKPFEYRRTLSVLRFYQLDLSGITQVKPYNLSDHPKADVLLRESYLAGDLVAQQKAWPMLPNAPEPLGQRVWEVSFAPISQAFDLHFDPAVLRQWQTRHDDETESPVLKVQIFSPYDGSQPVISYVFSEPSVLLQLFNKRDDKDGSMARGSNIEKAMQLLSSRIRDTRAFQGTGQHGSKDLYIEAHRAETCALTHQYELQVIRNEEEVFRIPLNFLAGPERKVSGQVAAHPKTGRIVQLTLQNLGRNQVTNAPIPIVPNDQITFPLDLNVNVEGQSNFGTWHGQGKPLEYTMRHSDDWIDIVATVTGYGLEERLYRGRVQVGNASYTMWGIPPSADSPMEMKCSFARPFASVPVTVSIEGLSALSPVRFTLLNRENPPSLSSISQAQSFMNQAAQELRQRPRDVSAAWDKYASCGQRLADVFYLSNRHQEAIAVLEQVLNAVPVAQQRASYRGYCLDLYVKIASSMGDAKRGIAGIDAYVPILASEFQDLVRRAGPQSAEVARQASKLHDDHCLALLKQRIALGGDYAGSERIWTLLLALKGYMIGGGTYDSYKYAIDKTAPLMGPRGGER